MQSDSVVVPPLLYRPPPFAEAKFPLKVQSFSVVVPKKVYRPPPFAAELPLTVHVGQRGRADEVVQAAAAAAGGVAADRAAGQRGRADGVYRPPPFCEAELPLTVQSVSVVVPYWSVYRPPPLTAELPLIVQSVSVGRAAVVGSGRRPARSRCPR